MSRFTDAKNSVGIGVGDSSGVQDWLLLLFCIGTGSSSGVGM